jgi:hypothetical protein
MPASQKCDRKDRSIDRNRLESAAVYYASAQVNNFRRRFPLQAGSRLGKDPTAPRFRRGAKTIALTVPFFVADLLLEAAQITS